MKYLILFLCSIIIFGCSDSFSKLLEDNDPPGNITELQVLAFGADHLKLSWKPPSDQDSNNYNIYYQNNTLRDSIDYELFTNELQVNIENEKQGIKIDGLLPETNYSFAVSVQDKNGNEGEFVFLDSITTLSENPEDLIQPSSIEDLNLSITSSTNNRMWFAPIILDFTAPGDDDTEGLAELEILFSLDNWETEQIYYGNVFSGIGGEKTTIELTLMNGWLPIPTEPEYSFQIKVKVFDEMGNEAVSEDSVSGVFDVKVSASRCIGCWECVDVCPTDAIMMIDGKAVIDTDNCIRCGFCVDECILIERNAIRFIVREKN